MRLKVGLIKNSKKLCMWGCASTEDYCKMVVNVCNSYLNVFCLFFQQTISERICITSENVDCLPQNVKLNFIWI